MEDCNLIIARLERSSEGTKFGSIGWLAAQALREQTAEIELLKGDYQLMKLSRDAKLCSQCPRIPEWNALSKDAERYRWLRDHPEEMSADNPLFVHPTGEAYDAAIDAAMTKSESPSSSETVREG